MLRFVKISFCDEEDYRGGIMLMPTDGGFDHENVYRGLVCWANSLEVSYIGQSLDKIEEFQNDRWSTGHDYRPGLPAWTRDLPEATQEEARDFASRMGAATLPAWLREKITEAIG